MSNPGRHGDKGAILRIHDEWIELEASGKAEGILGLCSQDVVWLVPGLGALQGIEEVRDFLIGQPETVIVSIDTFNVAVEVSDELAVKSARFSTTFMDGGASVTVTGMHIWTLRKDSQTGHWRVTSVAWVIDADAS